MTFKKQGKAKKADENKIEIIKPVENNKITASMEENIICPHCNKVIGTKVNNIYQILDQKLVALNGTKCPHCKGDLK